MSPSLHFKIGPRVVMLALELFKLNGLVAPLQGLDHFIFALNFNLPEEYLRSERIDGPLTTVQSCIEDEFPEEIIGGEVYFRISATYTLSHVVTNEERLWQGSFQPRTNQEQNILSNRPYVSDTFMRVTEEAVALERVVQKLELAGADSDWTLSSLKSVILSFQAKCKYATHPFRADSLVIPTGRIKHARQRKTITFDRILE